MSKWAEPIYTAFLAGAWRLIWTPDCLFWMPKPIVSVEVGPFGRRLHDESGPALTNDLEHLYFIRGVLVPAHVVVEPSSITLAEIDGESNAEVRRIMTERYGWDRYLLETGAQILDGVDDLDGIHQALASSKTGDKLLLCACPSTGRTYALEVDGDCSTVAQAQNYLRAPEVALRGVMTDAEIKRAAGSMPLAQT